MAEPGPRNLITDVPGLLVGQAEDSPRVTGTTVVLCETPAVGVGRCARRGAGHPRDRVARSGDIGRSRRRDRAVGRLGLRSRRGVWRDGRARRDGARLRRCAACACRSCRRRSCSTSLFPGDGTGPASRPIAGWAGVALERAAHEFALGNAGAGFGAKAGRLKGGIGQRVIAPRKRRDGRRARRSQQPGQRCAAGLRPVLGGRAGIVRRDRRAAIAAGQ